MSNTPKIAKLMLMSEASNINNNRFCPWIINFIIIEMS